MHVALIIDEERLAAEHATLSRLTIGMIGEGVQVTRVVPDAMSSDIVDAGEQRMALASRIEIPMRSLPWLRRERAARLSEAMERSPPDVIFAVGAGAWPIAIDLARRLDRPLVIDVWSSGLVRGAPRSRPGGVVAGYVTPTAPIAEALGERVDPALVCLVRTGVALPPEPRAILADPERSIALAVIGRGGDVPAYRAVLTGLGSVVRELPQIHVFLELAGPHEHEIWRHARSLELLGNLSTISDASQHRALLTYCDALVVPERFGELRSLMLDAMAYGIPVLAGADPALDMLVDDESAVIVPEIDPEAWAGHFRRLIAEPDTARRLGRGGREVVAHRHRSSEHVSRLIETFQQLAGGTYRFA